MPRATSSKSLPCATACAQCFSDAYVGLDFEKSGHALYLHQQWRRVPLSADEQQAAAGGAPDKMQIGGEGGFELGPPPKHKVCEAGRLSGRTIIVRTTCGRIALHCFYHQRVLFLLVLFG